MSNMKKKPIVTIRLSAILRVRRRRRKGGGGGARERERERERERSRINKYEAAKDCCNN